MLEFSETRVFGLEKQSESQIASDHENDPSIVALVIHVLMSDGEIFTCCQRMFSLLMRHLALLPLTTFAGGGLYVSN